MRSTRERELVYFLLSNPRGLGLLIKEAKGWRGLGKGQSPSPFGAPAKEGREESLPFPNSDWGEE